MKRFPLALGCLLASTGFGQVTINLVDGTFDSGDYSEVFLSGTSGGQTVTYEADFGNPGSMISITTGTNDPVKYAWINTTLTVNPSATPITSIDFDIDYRPVTVFGGGMGFGPILLQDGVYYEGYGVVTGGTPSGVYSDVSGTSQYDGMVASDFTEVGGAANPDFSSSGGIITFGFTTGNVGGSGINAYYDNLSYTVTAVPEPSTYAAIVGVVAGLVAIYRRKRRAGNTPQGFDPVPRGRVRAPCRLSDFGWQSPP